MSNQFAPRHVRRLICWRHADGPDGAAPERPPEKIDRPSWQQVVDAIRRLDDFAYPAIELVGDPVPGDSLIVVGGRGRYSVADLRGTWMYERAVGFRDEVRLWTSGQGYYCRERNLLYSRRAVLLLARVFFDAGAIAPVSAIAKNVDGSRRQRHRKSIDVAAWWSRPGSIGATND